MLLSRQFASHARCFSSRNTWSPAWCTKHKSCRIRSERGLEPSMATHRSRWSCTHCTAAYLDCTGVGRPVVIANLHDDSLAWMSGLCSSLPVTNPDVRASNTTTTNNHEIAQLMRNCSYNVLISVFVRFPARTSKWTSSRARVNRGLKQSMLKTRF